MKNTQIIFLFFLLLTQCLDITAQEGIVVRGNVSDMADGTPLPGVNVVEIDAQNRVVKGTITDVNGNYVIEVSDREHQLQFSFIGYEKESFDIESKTNISVELEESTLDIEEVQVVAQSNANSMTGVYHRDQTASSTRIDMENLRDQATVSAADALQGQVSGLDIVSASGNPGSGSNIVIRGMGSLGNTNPLIVVDGIPQDIKAEDFNFTSADQQDLGQLLSIAPQDIKSVEVLKDAASTAIWGSKGANGVLLIETRTGQKGKILFNYQYKFNANIQPPAVPMLNGDEYITLQLEQWHNSEGVYTIPEEISYNRNSKDFYNYSANTNWIEAVTRDSYTHDHFFKMSGGGANSNYYTSLNYQNGLGTTINTSYQRFSLRANFNYSLSDDLRFTTNFSYNNSLTEDNPENIRRMAYIKSPNMSIWEYDENGELTGDYFIPIESYQGMGDKYFNPVAIANLGKNDNQGNQIQNNFKIDYDILRWLRFQQNISFSYANDKGNKFTPYSAIGADWLSNEINSTTERNGMNLRWLSRSQLFLFPFRSSRVHSMTGVVMWEMEQKQYEWMQISNANNSTIAIIDPASNAPINHIRSGSTQSRLFGALASINYKFKDKYLMSFNVRSDGSSAFGESNQWGLFPSASIGWRFSHEEFFNSLEFLQEGKLRISWGQSGKSLNDPYATYAYYESSGTYMDESVIVPMQIQLSELKWQTVSSWDLGLDLNLFSNRLTIVADAYNKVTTDLLWRNYDIAGSSGYDRLAYFNGGEIQNIGWEFFVSGLIVQREELNFSLNFNISQNRNSYISFPDNFKTERDVSIGNGIYPRKAEIGNPIGSFYGFRYLGVYPTDEDAVARDANDNVIVDSNGEPIFMTYQEGYKFKGGDAIYKDMNNDGKIDIMDAVYIGDSSPDFIGGFGTIFNYKKISASLNFHYRLGFDIVNQVAIETEGMLDRNNQSTAVLYRWQRYGQDEEGLLPRAYMNHPVNNLGSDRYVERGDFLRLNNLSISYRLDREIATRMGVNSMNIGINIRKLLTFTNYSGQDPEIGLVGNDPFWMGQDNARTPVPKVFSFQVTLNF